MSCSMRSVGLETRQRPQYLPGAQVAVRYCIRRRFPRHGAGSFESGGGFALAGANVRKRQAGDVGAQRVGRDQRPVAGLARFDLSGPDQLVQRGPAQAGNFGSVGDGVGDYLIPTRVKADSSRGEGGFP